MGTNEQDPTWASNAQGAYRWQAWLELGSPAESDRVLAAQIHQAGLYGGAQVIFVDKGRTSSNEHPDGITASLLHTESISPMPLMRIRRF